MIDLFLLKMGFLTISSITVLLLTVKSKLEVHRVFYGNLCPTHGRKTFLTEGCGNGGREILDVKMRSARHHKIGLISVGV